MPPVTASAALEEKQPVIAALRDHIHRLESQHAAELRDLRSENEQLRRQLETALGRLLVGGATTPS